MNKVERAGYLVSLSALLKDQDASGANLRSKLIGEEYEREWALLKKDIEDEARKSADNSKRSQDRAEQPRSEPRRSSEFGEHGRDTPSRGAPLQRTGDRSTDGESH